MVIIHLKVLYNTNYVQEAVSLGEGGPYILSSRAASPSAASARLAELERGRGSVGGDPVPRDSSKIFKVIETAQVL